MLNETGKAILNLKELVMSENISTSTAIYFISSSKIQCNSNIMKMIKDKDTSIEGFKKELMKDEQMILSKKEMEQMEIESNLSLAESVLTQMGCDKFQLTGNSTEIIVSRHIRISKTYFLNFFGLTLNDSKSTQKEYDFFVANKSRQLRGAIQKILDETLKKNTQTYSIFKDNILTMKIVVKRPKGKTTLTKSLNEVKSFLDVCASAEDLYLNKKIY